MNNFKRLDMSNKNIPVLIKLFSFCCSGFITIILTWMVYYRSRVLLIKHYLDAGWFTWLHMGQMI